MHECRGASLLYRLVRDRLIELTFAVPGEYPYWWRLEVIFEGRTYASRGRELYYVMADLYGRLPRKVRKRAQCLNEESEGSHDAPQPAHNAPGPCRGGGVN